MCAKSAILSAYESAEVPTMLEELLEKIHRIDSDPTLDAEYKELSYDYVDELRQRDLARVWSLLQELMAQDVMLVAGSSEFVDHEFDLSAEDAFIIFVSDLVEAAYVAKYQPVD